MECLRCGTENREGARFCGKCGATLSLVCPQCGTELPSGLRFCDSCGSQLGAVPEAEAPAEALEAVPDVAGEALKRLAPKEYAERLLATRGQVPAERRLVTILFSDVTGSTAMAEDLDPEDVMEIMDGAFDVLIEPVYRYEGTLTRLMGDAVLAFFGAPIAHEDDPERAIRAALDITAGAAEYAEKLQRERGIEGFNVRVGIHTGLVVVGEVGSDLRVEYTAMGDAINLAARIESAAEPGTLLISEATHKLIAPLFHTEALGPIQLKGKAEAVSVYRVLAAKEVPGKVRGIAGLESPLVGREAEFAALQEVVERLQAGIGGVVTLVGEAGLGKSRLVAEVRKGLLPPYGHPEQREGSRSHRREILRSAQHDKVASLQWLEGRCLSYGSSIAYLLWLDVLRGFMGVTGDDPPQAVADALRQQVQQLCPQAFDDVYPYVAQLVSLPLGDNVAARLDELDGQELRARTFEALKTLFERAASQRPLVIVCEDLHWADPTSIELLEQLLALAELGPLLLLCVFRPVKDHACWRFRELAAQTYTQRHTNLVLDPLSPAQSETLVANLLRIEDLPEALRERILSRAEGNPFYVEEVIRSLIDRDAIVQDQATGRWTATREVADIPIPDTLQGVLTARIDRLQEDTKRVLQMASVIGRIFLYRVLAQIAAEERRLDDQLLTLQQQEMIRERVRIPELEYIFKHALTREAAYDGLLKKQRRAFHRQVAEALERLFPERMEEHVGMLAHHWERAADADKATEYLLRAADQARLTYAHQEAIGYYERALAFVKQQGNHERAARTLMKLGLTHHTAFDFQRARDAYQEGFELWRQAAAAQLPASMPPAPHALRVHWLDPPGLDRTTERNVASDLVIDQLFSGLVALSPDMSVVPDVARSWEMLEGGRKYVFHLREDVYWSDGAPVTAGDFVYAWKRALDPAGRSPIASMLYDVKAGRDFHQSKAVRADVGVRALGEHTLEVELEVPSACFLHMLVQMYPLPRHVVEAHAEDWTRVDNIVTCGPFRLEAWQPGESITLVRNGDYHGHFGGNVQRVELSLLRQASSSLEMYESGSSDVLDLVVLPPSWRDRARQRHAGEYVSIPWLSTQFVQFDVSRPPFDDPSIRQAFVLATDRNMYAGVAMRGYDFPATGGLVPPGMPGHSPGISLPYDPEGARGLLTGAGHPQGRGFPVVHALAYRGAESRSEYLQAQWEENLGVQVMWELVEHPVFFDRVHEEQPHLILTGWAAGYADPDSFLRLGMEFFRSHLPGWQNAAYVRLVDEAKRVMVHSKRIELYEEADRILVEDAAIMPLGHLRWHLLVKPWVRKYPTSAIRTWYWKDVVIEPH